MTIKLLFPPWFRFLGIALLIPGAISGYCTFIYSATETYYDEAAITLLSLGLLFIGFSRLKKENDEISVSRLTVLYIAVLCDLALVALLWLLSLINSFLKVPLLGRIVSFDFDHYSWLLVLVIFVCKFHLSIRKVNTGSATGLRQIPYMPFNLIGKICTAILLIISITAICLNLEAPFYLIQFSFFPLALFLLIASRERNETGLTRRIRLYSMQWAVCLNYLLFISTTWLVYEFSYLYVLIISLISIPILFIAIFYTSLAIASKKALAIQA